MKLRRTVALAAAFLLLCSLTPARAAAGSAEDPLLSRSYLTAWSGQQTAGAAAGIAPAIQAVQQQALQLARQTLPPARNNALRMVTMPVNGSAALRTGDFFTLTAGAAVLQIHSGTLVDATEGHVAASGAVRPMHRYIACEGLSATLTCTRPDTALCLFGPMQVSWFADVPLRRWFTDPIDYVYASRLIVGMSDTEFRPDLTLSRAMFVTILGRLAGVETESYPGNSFIDTQAGRWYSPYVEWGYQNKIVSGMGGGCFAPDEPVSREQMASLIARYAAQSGVTIKPAGAIAAPFPDAAEISGWARDGVELMRTTGILSGDAHGYFNPQDDATRAEAASIFMRLSHALAPA